jgi:hypothetical protein
MQPRQGGGVTLVRPNSAAPGNYVRQGLTRLDANWGSGRNSQLPDARRMGRGANSLNGQPTEHFPMAPRAPLRAQHDLRVTGSGRGAAVGQQERGTKTAPHASRQRPPVSEDWVRGLLPSPGRQAGGHPAEAAPDWSPVMMRPSTADASRSSGLGGLYATTRLQRPAAAPARFPQREPAAANLPTSIALADAVGRGHLVPMPTPLAGPEPGVASPQKEGGGRGIKDNGAATRIDDSKHRSRRVSFTPNRVQPSIGPM